MRENLRRTLKTDSILGRTVVLAVALSGALTGCDKIEDIIEDRVRERAANQQNGEDPGDIEADVQINSVRPNRGEVSGGEIIEIVGFGFAGQDSAAEAVVEVRFGPSNNPVASPFVDVVSDTLLRVSVPPFEAGECELEVTIRVTVDDETAALGQAFTYFQPVALSSLTPSRGPTAGGTLLTMVGGGFVEGTQVQVGDANPIEASVIGCSGLTVGTPALPRGIFPVRVSNENGTATLAAAFETFEPVTVTEVSPIAVPIAGGSEVFVAGTGFVPGTTLTIGTQVVVTSTNEEETVLTLQAPGAAGEGAVNVAVDNENGSASLLGGLIYYDDSNPTPRIVALTPQAARPEGGTTVNVVVAGFDDASTQIFIDDVPVLCIPDLHVLQCTVPAGTEGAVDVRAVNGTDVAVLPGGFQYIDLRLDSLLPNRGAIAGGTWVQVFGNGFQSDTRVFFGQNAATEISVINSQSLTAYSPRGILGLSDVRVETLGLSVVETDAFTYFDPAQTSTATGGGSIEGSVNVTVTDRNGRVADAFVALGANPSTSFPHLSGFTNEVGQITLSGPEVFGSQTVHASKPGHGSFSWVDVDASHLSMGLSNFPEPPPDPLPECPQGGGGAPPLIEGSVFRIKDELNTGLDTVVVTTTFASTGSPLPLPGSDNEMINQGDYTILARTGDLMVIALAGTLVPSNDPFNPGDKLDVHAMGVRPFLFTEASSGELCFDEDDCTNGEQCRPFGQENFCFRVYEDIDITIDIPVTSALRVELDSAPVGISTAEFGAAPTQTVSSMWYDFGSMGVFPAMDYPMGPYDPFVGVDAPPIVLPLTDTIIYDTPEEFPPSLPATFEVVAQVVGQGFSGDVAWSASLEDNLLLPSSDVQLGPYLPVDRDDSPGLFGLVSTEPMAFQWSPLPAGGPQATPTGYRHVMFTITEQPVCMSPFGPVNQREFIFYWQAIAPGHVTGFDLPTHTGAVAGANIPGGERVLWQTNAFLAPGTDFNAMNTADLFAWRSQSLRLTAFDVPVILAP